MADGYQRSDLSFPNLIPHDGQIGLSLIARSTLSSNRNQAFSYWLLAFSWTANAVWLRANG